MLRLRLQIVELRDRLNGPLKDRIGRDVADERLIDDRGERLHTFEWNCGLDLCDDALYGRNHGSGIARRPHGERERIAAHLRKTVVEMRLELARGVSIADRTNDADDRQPCRITGRANAFAERLSALPIALRECFVDESDRNVCRVVGRGDVASEEQGNANGREISRGHRCLIDLIFVPGRRNRSPLDEVAVVVVVSLERQR